MTSKKYKWSNICLTKNTVNSKSSNAEPFIRSSPAVSIHIIFHCFHHKSYIFNKFGPAFSNWTKILVTRKNWVIFYCCYVCLLWSSYFQSSKCFVFILLMSIKASQCQHHAKHVNKLTGSDSAVSWLWYPGRGVNVKNAKLCKIGVECVGFM